MRRLIGYVVLAMVLGVSIVLVPLVALAQLRADEALSFASLPRQMTLLEGTRSTAYDGRYSDVEALSFSFFVAAIVYLLFKRKTPRRNYRFTGPYPF
ncbi:hypothetical protein KEJ15_01745 [Candidatus Bathyarchaeota archaeon]|nr:hypothetical protein [Candidatus Bathyarchaeota archaeon]